MSTPPNTPGRFARFVESFRACAGYLILAALWALAAGLWMVVRGIPALPSILGVGVLFWAVHLRTPAQRARVRMRRLGLPAWAVATAVVSFMVLERSFDTLLLAGVPESGRDPVTAWLRSGGGWAPIIAALVLLVPLVEETVYRGMMQTWLERRYGPTAALLCTGLIFGLSHLNLVGLPSLLMSGLVFSYAFRASGSLWLPLLLHAAANGTVVLAMAGLPFGVRASWVLLLPSAAVLAWLGVRFRSHGDGERPLEAPGRVELAPAS